LTRAASYSVPSSLASKATTVDAALAAAAAVSECRVLVSLLSRQRINDSVDAKLYELELAYYRRADELERVKKSFRRSVVLRPKETPDV
jgi:hypothetical protein